MANSTRLDAIDLLTEESVQELATTGEGPCVSISMPTHRHGPDTQQGPVRLRQLLEEAEGELATHHGLSGDAIDELLAPARDLLRDEDFWQHQADGLVIYLAHGVDRRYRVPMELREGVVVGSCFRLRPLVPLIAADGRFHVLALSREQVRLFEARRLSIREIELDGMPRSFEDAVPQDDPDGLRARHGNASANGRAHIHGHGGDAERDKHEFERYIRAIDPGLRKHIGDGNAPLVVACIGYKLPIFKAISDHPNVVDQAIEGNPNGRRAEELHAAAWEIVEPIFGRRAEQAWERYGQLSSSGKTTCEIAEIIERAIEGRVEALLVTQGEKALGRVDAEGNVTLGGGPGAEDLVDCAISAVLRQRGRLFAVEQERLDEGCSASAVLRY